ncbi:MAG: helix-turn-helix domain-containing protein [Muribaculaceae bacterium]|nr:helix-turn-helix domain-containing protein [Muribaculaceae bacterium]
MDIVSRLMAFKDSTGLTNSQFADKAEIARPTLSQFLNGRNKRLSDELISKLHIAFPELNVSWLLFGEGDMRLDSNFEISEGSQGQKTQELSDYSPVDEVLTSDEIVNFPVQEKSQSGENDIQSVNIDRAAHEIASKVMTKVFEGAVPHPATEKKIKSIMVFYSDNSYETFTPQD